MIKRLTDAPEVYDGFGTKTIEEVGTSNRVGATGNPVRLVQIENAHDEWQLARYDSGMYAYTSSRVNVSNWTNFGDWSIAPETLDRLDRSIIEGFPVKTPPRFA